jgi:hypothetical protein
MHYSTRPLPTARERITCNTRSRVSDLHAHFFKHFYHVQFGFQVETEAIAAEELLSAAKGIMASQPQGLLQSLLRQVQQLFDVPQLEQLPAAMNKVGECWRFDNGFFSVVGCFC